MIPDVDLLEVKWFAVVDDLVGGWDVATADKPASQISNIGIELVIGCFMSEAIARHIAETHNSLRGLPRRRTTT